ncbi:PBSX family phage terminase large subunit [Aerococcus viridans]|uniref:PBSX family phage terminase large subunit n=1 Tax=Aerococcus viridans TaxID=1377 RepID=A0A2N6UG45_9LACT|nr:PBSX family phage terminase large subunit [Aerococcus viridans]PMC80542.1 PBSX family phage terminase large subunit [Aerococcus viridans]
MKISSLIPTNFHSAWRASLDPNKLHIACKGGRGSGKSSNVAHIIVQMLMRYAVNGVAIRKTDNTLEQSVYEQIKWAIAEQQVTHLFKFNKSPLRITYKPRGNYIVFRGAQNPERIKSLKDSQFPFAIGWIEELAEFKTEDEVKTITNSLLRGELADGLFYKFFYTYNPPKRKQSWVNKKYETQFQPNNTFVHASTYLDNPFIAKAFIEEAEATKERSERRYRWEYLGEAIGSGVVPFDNLRFETITDEQLATFDNFRNGLDYGYATDPLAFVRWHYDKKKNGIYAVDELYGQKMSNRQTAKILKERGYQSDYIYADSAEPKSNAEMRDEYGFKKLFGVKKGPDSVEFGEQWLDDLDFICIDPNRTPNIAWEFENIDYQVDRDGNPRARLEDKDNHCIVGNTLVDTDKGQIPISELVGKKGNVHTYNFDTGNKELSAFEDVRMTRPNADVYELELEDGTTIQSTDEHLFLTENGWKKLKEITENDRIINVSY